MNRPDPETGAPRLGVPRVSGDEPTLLLTFTPTMNGTRAMTVMLLWFRQINVCSQRRAQKPCWLTALVRSSAKQIRELFSLKGLVFRCLGSSAPTRWAASCRSPAVRCRSSSRFMPSTSSTLPDPNPMLKKRGSGPFFIGANNGNCFHQKHGFRTRHLQSRR